MDPRVQLVRNRSHDGSFSDRLNMGEPPNNHGDIAPKWNRFGIAASERPTRLRGGRGFNSFAKAAQPPHMVSRADCFLVPKLLIFSKEIKFFKRAQPNSFDETRPIDPTSFRFRVFIFPTIQGLCSENCREIPRGGGRVAWLVEGQHEPDRAGKR
jgi:hypothetical protein